MRGLKAQLLECERDALARLEDVRRALKILETSPELAELTQIIHRDCLHRLSAPTGMESLPTVGNSSLPVPELGE